MQKMISDGHPCLNCLQNDCMSLKVDRRGGLYTRCRSCGTITFLYCDAALACLRTVWRVPLTLDQVREKISEGKELPRATREVRT